MNAYEWGVAHGSCAEALEQRKAYASQPEWYLACKRGDWLAWQLGHLPDELYIARLRKAVEAIVDRAVKIHALPHPKAKDWAKKWLSKEDRSLQTIWDLKLLASTGPASWTANAVMQFLKAIDSYKLSRAMESTWHAARAAADFGDALELRRQADDIHRFIPTWPGED